MPQQLPFLKSLGIGLVYKITMGSAAVHESGTETAAVRVGGACSSTRPELVGILLAIQTTPSERELWILVDSSSAISRLSWFKRETFRPPGYKVKDADVI